MIPKPNKLIRICATLATAAFLHRASLADAQPASPPGAPTSPDTPDTRYGLFNALDHRSWYNQGNFPEPFLVDDSGLEINETRLDWLYTQDGNHHNNLAALEVEKGFDLLTVELKLQYERDTLPGQVSQGLGNIEVGVRQPFYQFVTAHGFFDTTLGAAFEAGIPVGSAVSQNTELVPKLFNDLRIGENFTLQSLLGYSLLLGGGQEGGLHAFEYGFVFGYSIQHRVLPLPGVQQLIPIFELRGETELNLDSPGRNTVLGNAAFRVNLNPIGRVQPRLGLGFVFPVNSNAREDVHWGIFTSLVFEY